jgi:hypothetical protein
MSKNRIDKTIKNIKQESAVSLELLRVRAESSEFSIEEFVCREGLPVEPTFAFLVTVLEVTRIENSFKEYVVQKVLDLAKTDEELSTLASGGFIQLNKNEDSDSIQAFTATIPSFQFILPETVEKIQDLQGCLTPDISNKDRILVFSQLDIIVSELIEKAGDQADKLLEIYNLVLPSKCRTPYLRQRLMKKGYSQFLK